MVIDLETATLAELVQHNADVRAVILSDNSRKEEYTRAAERRRAVQEAGSRRFGRKWLLAVRREQEICQDKEGV
jgi:hypothetical protein